MLAQMWTAFFTEGVEPVRPSIAEVSDGGPVPLKQPVQHLLIKIDKSSKLHGCALHGMLSGVRVQQSQHMNTDHIVTFSRFIHVVANGRISFVTLRVKSSTVYTVHTLFTEIGEGRSKVVVTKGEAKAVFSPQADLHPCL